MPEFIQERKSKDGKYVTYRVNIPYYDKCNNRVFFSESFSSKKYGSKKVALEMAKECRDKMRKILNVDKIVIDAKDYSIDEIFYMSFESFPLSYETKRKHVYYFKRYIKPFCDELSFKSINSLNIQKSLNSMAESSSQDEINRIFSIWKRIYKTAIFHNIAMYDLTLKVTVPKSNKVTIARSTVVTKETLIEISDLIIQRVSRDDSVLIYCALWIMYYTGMRPSEVYALEWKNIDRINKTIFVCQAIGSTKSKKNTIVKTKTQSSIRTIPYPDELEEIFDMLESDTYLFKRKNGEFLNGNYVSNILRRLSKGKLRTYMLRHQFSTDLLTNNVDIRTVQELMGHTSGSMSLEYARSNPELMKKAIKNR